MNNKFSARAICLLLLLSMTASVSCGGEKTPADTSSDTVSDTTAPEVDPLDDNLPERDYGGYTFTVATETENEWLVLQDEETGDVVEDAIYKRNMAVEERFNVQFDTVVDSLSELGKLVQNSIMAGDDDIDLCCTHVVNTGNLAMSDIFLNWYDIPFVDFSKPWWARSTVDDLSVDGVCILAVGDFALTALANTNCIMYNKRLAEEYGITDLYTLAFDGGWTIDKVRELTKDIYVDIDSSGNQNNQDLFGYVSTSRSALNAFLWSFGGHVLKANSNGELELVYHNDKTADMVTKLCSFFYDNEGIYINSKEPTYDSLFSIYMFKQNQAVFINSAIGNSLTLLRDMKDDYGLLPYPKWDENQDEYYTMVDGSHDILCVPATASDPERTGIITEALCAESYKKVVPAYYEVALKTKYTRDDESVQMLDLISNSRVFDMGYVYDAWKGASFLFQELIAANNTNFESKWASKSSAITEYYNSVIEYFKSYKSTH